MKVVIFKYQGEWINLHFEQIISIENTKVRFLRKTATFWYSYQLNRDFNLPYPKKNLREIELPIEVTSKMAQLLKQNKKGVYKIK